MANIKVQLQAHLFNPGRAVVELQEKGAYCFTGLDEHTATSLFEETKTLEFKEAPRQYGKKGVEQELWSCDQLPENSSIFLLRDQLQDLISSGFAMISPKILPRPLIFHETVVQRYDGGSMGITPHLDSARCFGVVAVASLRGRARFGITRKRNKIDPIEFYTQAGSILLMRAGGFMGSEFRPPHFIDQIPDPRTVVRLVQRRDPDVPTYP
jgi:hypothetical protein